MNKKLIIAALAGLMVISGAAALTAENTALAQNGPGNAGNMMSAGRMSMVLDDDSNGRASNRGRGNLNDLNFAGGVFDNRRFDSRINQTEESISIKANGDFKVTGVAVNAVSSSTNVLSVSLLGFARDVNVSGATIHDANGTVISLSSIRVGDKLSATGNFNRTTRAITVSRIVDVSLANQQAVGAIEARIQELFRMVEQLRAQLNQLMNR